MKTIKVKYNFEIPKDYTGVVEFENEDEVWYKNGNYHREDGPVVICKGGYKSWWLDGKGIWNSYGKLDLTNQIVLSKTKHSLYPTVQVWKILNKSEVYEQIVIPGMEEFIKE